jgi:hypothetical protein
MGRRHDSRSATDIVCTVSDRVAVHFDLAEDHGPPPGSAWRFARADLAQTDRSILWQKRISTLKCLQ